MPTEAVLIIQVTRYLIFLKCYWDKETRGHVINLNRLLDLSSCVCIYTDIWAARDYMEGL